MNTGRFSTLLHDVEIEGTITFTGTVTFDGQLRKGEVIGEDLVIGPNAVIEGNINATSLVVHGSVTGDVVVTGRCELKSTASLSGSLISNRLIMQEGAALIGGVVIARDSKPRPTS